MIQDFLENFDVSIEVVLIGLAAILVFMLIVRELVAWYWKINKVVRLQNAQNELLEQILNELRRK